MSSRKTERRKRDRGGKEVLDDKDLGYYSAKIFAAEWHARHLS